MYADAYLDTLRLLVQLGLVRHFLNRRNPILSGDDGEAVVGVRVREMKL
jgi:hypothetical protein